jgi:dinuclear metal center YbgI/SA1388 family protein
MILREITTVLEELAPLSLQESYDNSGLIYGKPEQTITGAVLSLDCTEAVIEEAIRLNCNLVIAHHPIVFGGLKKITGRNYVERTVIKAIQSNVAIYAIHTNLDNVSHGVNQKIAEKLGLLHTRILQPMEGSLRKLTVFVPSEQAELVRQAMFLAGGGRIGNYDECSFNLTGNGTFRPLEGSNPFLGNLNQSENVEETRIEMVVRQADLGKVVSEMLKAHPYEEVAYDVVALQNASPYIGSGMIGDLPESLPVKEFLALVKNRFAAPVVRFTETSHDRISKVAVCGGSGSFLISKALSAGADAFLTSDVKYHQFFDGEGKLLIADIGHFESEQYTPEILKSYLGKKFPTFATHFSGVRTNPVQYFY